MTEPGTEPPSAATESAEASPSVHDSHPVNSPEPTESAPQAPENSPETTESALQAPENSPESTEPAPQAQESETEEEEEEEEAGDGRLHHVNVQYCPRCRVPIGYCKFFGHDREAEAAALAAAAAAAANGEELPQINLEPAPTQKQKRRQNIRIVVKQRSRRKNTTTIYCVVEWDIDVKVFSKFVRTKMAIGCSTKKTKDGDTAVVIQGDVGKTVHDLLMSQYNVPKDAITMTVKKIKGKSRQRVIAPQPEFGDGQ